MTMIFRQTSNVTVIFFGVLVLAVMTIVHHNVLLRSMIRFQHHTSSILDNSKLSISNKPLNVTNFFMKGQYKPHENDITLVTHASLNKISRLLPIIDHWNGPISIAIYVPSISLISVVEQFYKVYYKKLSAFVDIHIVIEVNNEHVGIIEYPMNILRNLALDNIRSKFMFATDIDFLPFGDTYQYHSPRVNGVHEVLKKYIKTKDLYTEMRNRTLLVIPAFEYFMIRSGKRMKAPSVNQLPRTLEQLRTSILERKVSPFHKYFFPGHGPTNYTRWLKGVENPYELTYLHRFEPYVVAYAENLPKYWSGFRGFGFNKASWFMELHYMKFTFKSIPFFWVIHTNHPERQGRMASKSTVQEWVKFKLYLYHKYNISREELNSIPIDKRITVDTRI